MTTALRTARVAGFVLLAVAGWLLWPAAAGGSTTYVVTHGVSMQPRFSTGDLAVLRSAGSYEVGDVVAYTSPTLGTTVMHRIVAVDGGAFVTRGDNNSWQDPDHPTPDLIKGRLWLRVPQGGAAIQQLQHPGTLVLLGLAGSAVAWALRPRGVHRRRGRRHPPATRPAPTLPALPLAARAHARQAALVCAAVAVLAGAGEAVLLALPATETDTRTVVVDQQVRWGWSGTAVRGATYPTGSITTGDPVYTRLAGPVTVSLRDTVSGVGLTGLTGTVRLVLGVQSTDGWHADVAAGTPAAPAGGTVTAAVVLDPAAAGDLLHRHLVEVGASSGGMTLTVTPQVTLAGSVGGRAFTAAPVSALTFAADGTALRSAAAPAALSATVPTPVTTGVVVPRRFTLGSVSVPLDVAGTAVGVLAVAGVAAAGACALAGRGGGPADDAPLRASARLLPVRRFTPGRQVVDVEDGAALLRLAERLDLLVLHTAGDEPDGSDVFAVQDGDTTYRWTATAPPAGRAALRVVSPVA